MTMLMIVVVVSSILLLHKPSWCWFGLTFDFRIQVVIVLFSILGSLQTPRTYCAANTEDLETVTHYIHNLYPSAEMMASGVSMGG